MLAVSQIVEEKDDVFNRIAVSFILNPWKTVRFIRIEKSNGIRYFSNCETA